MPRHTKFYTMDVHKMRDGTLVFMVGSDLNYYDWKEYELPKVEANGNVYKVATYDYSNELVGRESELVDLYLKGLARGNFSTYRLD